VDNTESRWIQLTVNGDSEEAFANLVEKYQRQVFNLCYRMLGNAQDAEDAAQEVFWRAYKSLHRYDPKRSFIAWILSIAAHYCIDQHRKRRLPTFAIELLPDDSIPLIGPSPESIVVQTGEELHIHKMLDHLKPKDRAALILRYWYDFSEVEISRALSLSKSAVKSRLHRARRKLAKVWQVSRPQSLAAKELV